MTRADLHRLVDELPDESVDAAGVLLARAKDPVLAALEAAPFDDEPYAGDDRAASEEGWTATNESASLPPSSAYRQAMCEASRADRESGVCGSATGEPSSASTRQPT
jgi:hypothetical protein